MPDAVYIVTYPDENDQITVTAFDNPDAAKALYAYILGVKKITHPHRVGIDKVPIYSNFSSIDPFWDQ